MSRFKKVIVDADSMPYAIGAAAKSEPLNYALATVKSAIAKIKDQCDAEEVQCYVGGKDNFREEVAVSHEYKGTRSSDKPAHHPDIVEYLVMVQGAIVCDGMETDDVVSIELWKDYLACNGDRDVTTLILSSGDKDLNNTPGWHHNPRTKEVRWITEHQAARHFIYQMLMGDGVDNIKGIPKLPSHICKRYDVDSRGVGKKSAAKLMKEYTTLEASETFMYELYLHWGISEGYTEKMIKDYITEQGQLLWMVRELDEHGAPVMWQMDEVLYGQARERFEDHFLPDEGGAGGEGADDGYGYGTRGSYLSDTNEWVSEYSDKSTTPLRITPARSSKG
jgi:hypothetical protein